MHHPFAIKLCIVRYYCFYQSVVWFVIVAIFSRSRHCRRRRDLDRPDKFSDAPRCSLASLVLPHGVQEHVVYTATVVSLLRLPRKPIPFSTALLFSRWNRRKTFTSARANRARPDRRHFESLDGWWCIERNQKVAPYTRRYSRWCAPLSLADSTDFNLDEGFRDREIRCAIISNFAAGFCFIYQYYLFIHFKQEDVLTTKEMSISRV